MKFISTTFAVGILALFLGTQAHAADAGHTSQAMEHAEMGHADVAAKHTDEAIQHMKESGH